MIAYFVVGLVLGPNAMGILPDSESSRHFVEFGIVFLMFTIGLEFSLPKLNSMRSTKCSPPSFVQIDPRGMQSASQVT